MAVVLQRADGPTREYPLVRSGLSDNLLTECGARDCEHLDCAIHCAKDSIKVFTVLILGMVLALSPPVLFMIFLATREGEPLLLFAVTFAILAGSFLVLLLWSMLRQARNNLGELREFRERGTVSGIPARQVLQEAGKGE